MLITIANPSNTDYSANGFSLSAGDVKIINEDKINEISFSHTNSDRLAHMDLTLANLHPFVSGSSGSIPQYNLESNGAARLHVALADNLATVKSGNTSDIYTNE